MIRLDDVTFGYRSDHDSGPAVAGLSGVSLEVAEGEAVLLCGPSGSGKSSALRLVNGLIPHYHQGQLSGSIRLDDTEVSDQPLHRTGRQVSTVFQNPRTQFFSTDVLSELAFASENFGIDPDVIRERITAADATLRLGSLLHGDLLHLSGGQRQLVACAAAMVNRPRVYLFDEPASNLSPEAVARLRSVMTTLRTEGATMLIAEHRLHYLRGLIDRVVVLRGGAIIEQYRAETFWALPEAERQRLGLRALTDHPPQVDQVIHGVPGPTPDASGPAAGAPSGRGVLLEEVRFAYGRRGVLDIPHLEFPAGAVTVLTGPNGAGKSTLARVLCGLERATGRVLLDGRPVSARARREVSHLVMQDVHRQLFAASVADELALGTGHRPDDPCLLDLLDELGLAGLAERHPLSLSGGQKQRLVVAAARLADKRVHVFDEPTSGLDLTHLERVAAMLRSLAAEGRVVIVITHDAELTDRCADRVVEVRPLAAATGQ